ncbi:MAG: type II toxin-antitoxin system prevent-host-death family antitoxin [Planctomycetes bacterium]|nr:type II toxin-antitoxin system prevent-host-death family antitoxin [Planctomycetota bacterium]MCG2684182.1 type II toxin-antitoxin system prevent-host-death family antitoxin [Planctomycetales bacterium]
MAIKTVEIVEAQANLADLVSLAHTGVEVVLTKNNSPVATLVPVEPPAAVRLSGLHPGAIQTSDDFDRPLPDAFWMGEE